MPQKFRSKSHKRKKMIRDFLQNVRNSLHNPENVKTILKSHHPNYRKYLFPKVIEECIQIDNFDSLRELIQAYLNDVDYDSPLIHLAVKHQNEKLTKLLLDNYFDPNIVYPQKDISCLMIAAKDNNIPIVQMLIDQDVDVDYKTNKGGFDAKMIANHFGHRQIIQLLNK
jgi:ankyrin repeat protein